MNRVKLLGILAAAAVLAACTSDIERLRTTEGTGSAFTRALTDEYRDLTVFEADEMFDWRDARHFARKGLAAAGGEVVLPENPGDWDEPAAVVGEMNSARGRLVQLLDAGARDRVPDLAARAQVRFDCWVEQQEENHQADHIAACRDEFFRSLGELETAMAPQQPMPAPEPMMAPESFLVLFDWDKSNIRPDAQAELDRALAAIRRRGEPAITVTGHADRSGSEDYNLPLSLRRADAVRDVLIGGTVAADRITVSGRGEEEPAVPTADGVREQANRRVEIIIQ